MGQFSKNSRRKMRTFPLLVFLFSFLFLFLVERATCCLLKPGGTVVVEEQLTGLLRGKRSIAVEHEDQEPADQTETTVTTEEENDPGEADLELGGPTGETVTESVVVI